METKRCGHCKRTKPISDFAKNRSRKSGIHNECKRCQTDYNRIWMIQRNYKTTKEEAQALIDKFNKEVFCAICQEPLELSKTGYAIDHCHRSGKIRDLLCVFCNQGLGRFKDDLYILERAKRYLEQHG